MPDQRISVVPTPPVRGGIATVCYDFEGLDEEDARVTVTFEPPGTSTEYSVSRSAPCFEVQVPDDASELVVTDGDGPSADYETPVDP